MTIHDNELLFYTGKNVQMKLDVLDKVIASGQEFADSNPIILDATTDDDSIWKLTIRAGRKGSSEVADKFKSEVSRHQVIATDCTDEAHMPDKLNFYVKGTLTMTNEDGSFSADILVGQGHNARSHNNWWFGSERMVSVNPKFGMDALGIVFMKAMKTITVENMPKLPGIPELPKMPGVFWAQEKTVNSFDLYKMIIKK